MSVDLMLFWFGLEDLKVRADREDIRRWSRELGLPGRNTLSRDMIKYSFGKACEHTSSYQDADGTTRTINTVPGKATKEWIQAEVVRDDGYRLALLTYYMPRHTQFGTVRNSQRIRHTIRKELPEPERSAIGEWMDQALATYEDTRLSLPWPAIRRLIKENILLTGVPIAGRVSTYFDYSDQIETARRTAELLRRCSPNVEFEVITVAAHADRSLFVRSADEYLTSNALDCQRRIGSKDDRPFTRMSSYFKGWEDELDELRVAGLNHEQRLECSLPRLGAVLADARRQLNTLKPTKARLPRVSV